MKLHESVCNVLKRLDDYPSGGEQVWTWAEVELDVKEGYDSFCRQTKCIFDMAYAENVAQTGNYVGKWERENCTTGMISTGQLNFTGGYWERDYAGAGDIGPVNSTQPWESTYLSSSHLNKIFAVAVHDLPDGTVTVDRVTHDLGWLEPEWTRWIEENDRDYQETEGTPSRFTLDRDGLGRIRIVPAGGGGATTYDTSGTYGLLRSAASTDGLGTWAAAGTWGALREIPEHFPIGAPFGIPRRLYSDTDNTRVEYFRLGKDLDEDQVELPDRFMKYPEFYAQAKALEKDGPGQDLKLAQHFMERFAEGVSRMVKRLSECKRAVAGKIGSVGRVPTRPALARLPFAYGRQIRRGY